MTLLRESDGPAPTRPQQVQSYMDAAAEAARKGDAAGALGGWMAALKLLDRRAPQRVEVLRHLGTAHREAGDTAQADFYYRQSLELATQLADPVGMAHATNWIAVLAVHRGLLEDADAGLEHARALARDAGEHRLLGMIEQNRGVLASIRGDLDTAFVHYRAALDGFRAANDAAMIASVLNNVGLVAVELKRWDEAERSYTEAITTARDAGLLAIVNSVELNIGSFAARRAQWESVADSGARGIDIARLSRSRWREAEALRLKGMAAREQGRLDDAERDLTTAALLATEVEDRLLEAQVARELGELFRTAGRASEARAALSRALDVFQRIGASLDARRTETLLSELNSAARA